VPSEYAFVLLHALGLNTCGGARDSDLLRCRVVFVCVLCLHMCVCVCVCSCVCVCACGHGAEEQVEIVEGLEEDWAKAEDGTTKACFAIDDVRGSQ